MKYNFTLNVKPENGITPSVVAKTIAKIMNVDLKKNSHLRVGMVREKDITTTQDTSWGSKVIDYQLQNLPLVDSNNNIVGFLPGTVNVRVDAKKMNIDVIQEMKISSDNAFIFRMIEKKKNSKEIGDEELLAAALPTTKLEDLEKIKDSQNMVLRDFMVAAKFSAKENENNPLEDLRKDLQRDLRIDNAKILDDDDKAKKSSEVAEKIKQAFNSHSFSSEDIAHVQQAYSQEGAYFLNRVIMGAIQHIYSDDIALLVTSPSGANPTSTDFKNLNKDDKGDIYFTHIWENIPIMNAAMADERMIANLKGPHLVRFKLTPPENANDSWSFKFDSCQTENKMVLAALQGKLFKYENDVLKVDTPLLTRSNSPISGFGLFAPKQATATTPKPSPELENKAPKSVDPPSPRK